MVTGPHLLQLRALIVDRDPGVRALCREILNEQNWEVIEAADTDLGLRLMHDQQPDLLLIDTKEPAFGGLDVIRRLHGEHSTASILILSMGDAGDDQISTDAGLRVDGHIPKPLEKKQLAAVVRSLARLRRAILELQRSSSILGEQSHALTLLLEFSSCLRQRDHLELLLDQTLQFTARLTGCRCVAVFLPGAADGVIRLARSSGFQNAEALLAAPIAAAGRPLIEEVFLTRTSLVYEPDIGVKADGDRHALLPLRRPMLVMPMICYNDRAVGVLVAADRIENRDFGPHEIEYLRMICHSAAAAIRMIQTREARDDARDSIVIALAKLAEHRDNDTGRHLERVTAFCVRLAEQLARNPRFAGQIDEKFLNDLRRAAPLHDIGKVAIPDAILLKPGRLTPEQMLVMRSHAQHGADAIHSVLERCPDSSFLKMAKEIALSHHEWWNGAGYPQGKRGEQIPLPARILSIADLYDALTSHRVYKSAMTHQQAVRLIVLASGRQLDPELVHAFVECESEFAEIALKLADLPHGTSQAGATPVDDLTTDELIATGLR